MDTSTDTDDGTVTDALLTASRALVAVAAKSLSTIDDDVTLPQYRALVILAARGAQTVGQLADGLSVHPSTATRLCDRLVAKQLIERTQRPDNRRETDVRLSTSGIDVVEKVTTFRRAEIARIVGRIPSELRRPAVAALTAFAEAAGEIPTHDWSLGWS